MAGRSASGMGEPSRRRRGATPGSALDPEPVADGVEVRPIVDPVAHACRERPGLVATPVRDQELEIEAAKTAYVGSAACASRR